MENKISKDLPTYLDKSLSLSVRKEEFQKSVDRMMNPFENFDPETFDPIATDDEKEVSDRVRNIPPKQLPTFGIQPKQVREGQMIGMYESKQDLYLTFAHRCNDMQKEIDSLKDEIEKLKVLHK